MTERVKYQLQDVAVLKAIRSFPNISEAKAIVEKQGAFCVGCSIQSECDPKHSSRPDNFNYYVRVTSGNNNIPQDCPLLQKGLPLETQTIPWRIKAVRRILDFFR